MVRLLSPHAAARERAKLVVNEWQQAIASRRIGEDAPDLDGWGHVAGPCRRPGLDMGDFMSAGGINPRAKNGTRTLVAGVALAPGGFISVGTDTRDLLTVDLDDDGHLDLVLLDYSASAFTVLLGDGAGGFARRQAFTVVDQPQGMAAADLDADGHVDLAVSGYLPPSRIGVVKVVQ